jgi:MerR family gold-responsive transcriptional activator of gol and ges genes
MTIGEAAARSGVSAKMIRYYEQTGVFPAASRDSSGYRTYSEADIQLLTLVHHARSLGFSIEEVRTLLELAGRNPRSSASPAALAMAARYRSALAEKMDQIKALDTSVARCLCSHHKSRSRASSR